MTSYVALLRGINVGGSHRVAMADLRALFEALGCRDVATYIQSGNVLFGSDEREGRLVEGLSGALCERFGFEIPVVVRDEGAFRAAARTHPLESVQPDPRLRYVLFLGAAPSSQALAAFDLDAFTPDECRVEGRDVYVAYAEGSARSRLTVEAIERAFGTTATGRNWRTVTKLAELLASRA